MTHFERERTPDDWADWGHMSFWFEDLSAGTDDVWDYISTLNATGKIAVETEPAKSSDHFREIIPRRRRRWI